MDSLQRTLMGLRCHDCDGLRKVDNAGAIVRCDDTDVQIMHNGLRVLAGGYHGDWMAHLIRGLRGHHEPQEEALFSAVLRLVRHRSLIVEVGSFWSYYSMWFLREVPYSSAICIEPDHLNMRVGQKNAELNGLSDRVTFIDGFVGANAAEVSTHVGESTHEAREIPCFDIPAILGRAGGRQIEVLHVDAQGAETGLLSSLPSDAAQHIRFIFVSTHHSSISGSKTTHRDCLRTLREKGASILCQHTVQESFSGDGLIVASFSAADRTVPLPSISRNKARHSLFPEA